LVFGPIKLAVYVDGCFWHVCPEHGNWPRVNAVWWRVKLEQNKARDLRTDERLREAGWTVIRVWEHEDPVHAAHRIGTAVRRLRACMARGS
jgi:DNA mismatch endonuclease (patch repair protein)